MAGLGLRGKCCAVEFFSITSRIVAGGSDGPGASLLATRLQASLLRHAAEAFGPRWRGPFQREDDDPSARTSRPAFYDELAGGPGRVVLLIATRCDGACQAIRAALYRNADPGADFPPVLLTPDAEAVRAGALQATLRQLSQRPIPVYAIDLLGVSGSAMPDALRLVTETIAREGRGRSPARWILVLDPLYETRIGRWSAPDFFGEVRLEHAQPIDGVSLGVAIDPGASTLRLELSADLGSLYLGLPDRSAAGTLAEDIARVQRSLERSLESLRGAAPVEVERKLVMHPQVERLVQLLMDYAADAIARDAFVDGTLDVLAELRRESPDEAIPVAEFIAAYADSHAVDPVPVPDGAGFVEAIGRPPAVQSARGPVRRPEET